jgi:hypothetical protein
MICGPIIPNTLASLRDLIVQEASLIERGLHVVGQDLVLGSAAQVDALACDADGAPVLLFAAAPEVNGSLPARVLAARSWIAQNAAWLVDEIGDPSLRADRPPRCIVVGLEILADTLAELRRLEVDGLAVLQFSTFSLGGRQRLGLTELLGSTPAIVPRPDPVGATDAPGLATGSFDVPPGIADVEDRTACARFLDLVRRVDSRLTATGDRFSRRLFLAGRLLAEVGLVAGRLTVRLPGTDCMAPSQSPLGLETCLSAVDRVLRMALDLEVGRSERGTDPPAATDRSADRSADPHRTASAPVHRSHGLPAGRDPQPHGEARFTTEPIERRGALLTAPTSAVQDPPSPASDLAACHAVPESQPDRVQSAPRQGLDEDRFSLEPIRRSVARAQLSREEFSALGEDESET